MARAMASICNDERGSSGVMSGHERKTLRLSVAAAAGGDAVVGRADHQSRQARELSETRRRIVGAHRRQLLHRNRRLVAEVMTEDRTEPQRELVAVDRPEHRRGHHEVEEGKPALASVAFYENYQKRPKGERAPDSLAYLGQALIQLKKPADACKVYDEFEDVYGANASSSLRDVVTKGRTSAKCAG